MNREELGRLYPIFLVNYDDSWPALFWQEKNRLLDLLGNIALRIEHIGSTAIPGIKAKPTIDILIGLEALASIEEIEEKMAVQGWIKMEEQKDHLMFVKGYSPEGLEKESFHIHMYTEGHPKIADSLLFRDYLRAHHDAAREYEALKIELALEYRNDREAYTEGKGEFVASVLKLARKS
jgi:GrpB-like predicted nucleotidyltransferase (UPF0157 family)